MLTLFSGLSLIALVLILLGMADLRQELHVIARQLEDKAMRWRR